MIATMQTQQMPRKILSLLLILCLLTGLAPLSIAAAVGPFSDVPANAWYAPAVARVTEAGLMAGTSPTTFSPMEAMDGSLFVAALASLGGTDAYTGLDKSLKRTQAAVLIADFLTGLGHPQGTAESPECNYTDGAEIPASAQAAVGMVTRLGLMRGSSCGTFLPNQDLTRNQAAQLLANLAAFLDEDKSVDARVAALCADMTTDEKIGQVLLINFRRWRTAGQTEITGMTELNTEVASVIKKYHLGNIILFGENTATTRATAHLTAALQATAKENGDLPLLIGVDQEGGTVTRLGQGTCLPGNMALGAANNPALAREAGAVLGRELAALGIQCNFAPDADVNDNPANPVIGLRSFGSDATTVSTMAASLLAGMTGSGVLGCVKHFPGHGNTATDTHSGLTIVTKTKELWRSVEARPFQTLISSGVGMVMSAHIQYPSLDGTQVTSKSSGEKITLPATLSRTILTDILRGEFGFGGVICTDAMDMKAITDNFGEADAVIMALNAGADLVCNPTELACLDDVAKLETLYAALHAALKNGTLPQARLDEAVTRVLTLKLKSGLLDTMPVSGDSQAAKAAAVVGSPAHRVTERKLAEAAVTRYADSKPLALNPGETVLFAVPFENEISSVRFAVNRLLQEGAVPNITPEITCYYKAETISDELAAQIKTADHVVILSEQYGSTMNNPAHWQRTMPQAFLAAAQGKAVILSNGLPYDVVLYPATSVYLCYGYRGMEEADAQSGTITGKYGPNIPAGIGAVLGSFEPTGTLPVTLDGVVLPPA